MRCLFISRFVLGVDLLISLSLAARVEKLKVNFSLQSPKLSRTVLQIIDCTLVVEIELRWSFVGFSQAKCNEISNFGIC
jgi:hypothetical protein